MDRLHRDVIGKEMHLLPADDRQQIVALLASEGTSNRAIADAVGVKKMTVRRDKEQLRRDVAPDESGASPLLPEPRCSNTGSATVYLGGATVTATGATAGYPLAASANMNLRLPEARRTTCTGSLRPVLAASPRSSRRNPQAASRGSGSEGFPFCVHSAPERRARAEVTAELLTRSWQRAASSPTPKPIKDHATNHDRDDYEVEVPVPLGVDSIEYQECAAEDHKSEQNGVLPAHCLLWVGCAPPRHTNRGAADDQAGHRSSQSER